MLFRPAQSPKTIGDVAEARAMAWLQRKGLTLVCRNYRCRQGEIDLIMREGEFLVFVEVRKRTHVTHGAASESVTPRKQRRLVMAARHYIAKHNISADHCMRFDVVGIGSRDDSSTIDWIPNAFTG